MKKIYNWLFPAFFSFCMITSCDGDNEEIISMSHTDPVATVEKLSYYSGYAGSEFTITGTEFGIRADMVNVYIGSKEAEVLSCTETEIVVKVPADATDGKITVDVYGQRIETDFIYQVLGKPGVSKVEPQYGFPGDEITFIGHDLVTAVSLYTVYFGDDTENKAEIIGEPAEGKFTVKVPETAASGTVSLVVDGQSVDLSSYPFTVLRHAALDVPEEGEPVPSGFAGSVFTITGTNLVQELLDESVEEPGTLRVLFSKDGEEPADAVIDRENLTENSIPLTVPASLEAGGYTVTVITPFETVQTQLQYVVLPKPVVESVTPLKGYVGTEVTISGKNFVRSVEDIEVKFGETPATDIKLAEGGGTLLVKVPVLTDFGATALSLSMQGAEIELGEDYSVFEVLSSPVITSVVTDNVFSEHAVRAGDVITIEGSGFKNSTLTSAVFNGQELDFTVESDTKITASVSADSEAGEGAVVLHFEGVGTQVASTGKLNMLKKGSDVSEYVLVNGKRPFVSVEGAASGHCTPAGWSFNYGSGNDGFYHDESLAGHPGEGLFMDADGGLLVIQTGWDRLSNKQNGKMWQAIELPKGTYDIVLNVAEVNVDAGGRKQAGFLIQKGGGEPSNLDGGKFQWEDNDGSIKASINLTEKGSCKNVRFSQEDVKIDYDGVSTLGFVVQFVNNKCVKVSSVEILLKE